MATHWKREGVYLKDALSAVADRALQLGLPLPTIEIGHPHLALEFANQLAKDIGDPEYFGNRGVEMHDEGRPIWLFGTFDRIQIIAPRQQNCKRTVDNREWREHFGVMAEIWG